MKSSTSSRILLKNARVIDPSERIDGKFNILIEGSRIAELRRGLTSSGAEQYDLSGMILSPGFIDIHTHLRQPGKEEAETIRTGTLAAAAGGFTAVACMPNTQPVNDNSQTTEFILNKAREEAAVDVYVIASITQNESGLELNDLHSLRDAGAVAFSDDGKPVWDSAIMKKALELGRKLRAPIIDHCEEPALARGAAMNEGARSAKLGIPGMPAEAEEIMVARNTILARSTRGNVHLAHMSTAGSMELIRAAKKEGVPVTAEVTPHHFTLTDQIVTPDNTNTKMNPPLRSQHDLNAVLKAIQDGTVDVIASDHAPHHMNTKNVEYTNASFGIVGLETSVSLGLDRLIHRKLISMKRFIELYSITPARILGVRRGIRKGFEANITILDPDRKIKVDASRFQSKSRNTPFDGWKLKGCPAMTICGGKIVWQDLP